MNKMNKATNVGINQVGVYKYQQGTSRGGLVPRKYQGVWGNRGQGNELQSALEKALSQTSDMITNSGDYIEQGLAYLGGLLPGGMTANEALQNTKNKQTALKRGEPGYINYFGKYETFPITGVAPVLPKLVKNPTPEIRGLYDALKKGRIKWQVRESQLKKSGQLHNMESTLTAKRYRQAEQAYNDAVEASKVHMKKHIDDTKLTRKQTSAYKAENARVDDDLRHTNSGRPRIKGRQWDEVEKMMRVDPKAEATINRYDIKVAKGMDKKHLRETKKKMLEEYAKSKPGFFDYLFKD